MAYSSCPNEVAMTSLRPFTRISAAFSSLSNASVIRAAAPSAATEPTATSVLTCAAANGDTSPEERDATVRGSRTPDETVSDRLVAVLDITARWVAERLPEDDRLAPDARVMKI